MPQPRYTLFVANRSSGNEGVYAHFRGGLVDVDYWLGSAPGHPAARGAWGAASSEDDRNCLAWAMLAMCELESEATPAAVQELGSILRHAPDDWTITRAQLRGWLSSRPFWEMVATWPLAQGLMAPSQAAEPSRN